MAIVRKCAYFLLIFLAEASLFAQEGVGSQPPGIGAVFARMVPLFLIVFVIFYLMVIRPSEKKAAEQKKLIQSLKKGDLVVTASGIIGRFQSFDGNIAYIDIGGGHKLKVLASTVVSRFNKTKKDENSK